MARPVVCTDPVWLARLAERREAMAACGFPEGARVQVQVDAHPNIPEFARFHRGDEGRVVLNMLGEGDGSTHACVVFDNTASHTPHSVSTVNLRIAPERAAPVYSTRSATGASINVRERGGQFDVFVGGWRVATLKGRDAAIRRADREVPKR